MVEKDMNEEVEIDFQRIFGAIWRKIWIIILVAVICAVSAVVFTVYCVTPEYESSAMFYVNNNSLSLGDTSFSIESGDITAAKSLVDSYIVILSTPTTLKDVIDYAEVECSPQQLSRMISAEAVNDTEIFQVVVTSTDPYEAEKIASAISYILPKRISNIIEGTSARIVDTAVIPTKPSSPSYTFNTLVGFLLGFALMTAAVILQEVFDVTIRTEEDIQQVCKYPALAAVPDMGAPSKESYYDNRSKRKNSRGRGASKNHIAPALFGGNISFAASEAYKLLRTKLQFSFVDDSQSRVIGFSSALSGEGKSLTAINLAYTLSQLDKKVILIDCDMRRPTLANKLNIRKVPGLSGYLTGQHTLEEMIQNCNLKREEEAFHVIAAGQNPPNPVELLSSERMARFLQLLRQKYDYILLDLPPVGEVSDAMAVANQTDGMLLVVRQNYCDRLVLKDAVRQFDFINAKMLGVVYNCATESGARYGKNYYKRYYRQYGKNSYQRNHYRYEGTYMRKVAESKMAEDKK